MFHEAKLCKISAARGMADQCSLNTPMYKVVYRITEMLLLP